MLRELGFRPVDCVHGGRRFQEAPQARILCELRELAALAVGGARPAAVAVEQLRVVADIALQFCRQLRQGLLHGVYPVFHGGE